MYILNALTGKLLHTLDESEEFYKQQFANDELSIDTFHFNKKLKTEESIRQQALDEGLDSPVNCVFDKTEKFVVYGSMIGLKIVDVSYCYCYCYYYYYCCCCCCCY